MTTTIEHAEILERTIKYKYNEADEFCTQSLHVKPTEIQCRAAAQRLRELEKDAARHRWLLEVQAYEVGLLTRIAELETRLVETIIIQHLGTNKV